jgi:hypothetical protein
LTTFRNDLDAAHARIDALEQDKRRLAEENARLRRARLQETATVVPELTRTSAPPEPPPRRPPKETEMQFEGVQWVLTATFVAMFVAVMLAVKACGG